MASTICHIPNPIMNPVTTPTDPIPTSCSLRQDHLSLLKKNDPPTTLSSSQTQDSFDDAMMVSSAMCQENSTVSLEQEASCKLASVWRDIQGLNNWENLVEPLDPLLREEIVRYGEFVTACYKAFDVDPNSQRYLNCKYGKKTMMREVGFEHLNYEVTKYIYATAPEISVPIQTGNNGAKWIGYVAVAEDKEVERLGRRDIVITFRGTATNHEWMANLMNSLTPAKLDPHEPRPEVKVEAGFLSLYTSNESNSKFGLASCREQLLSEISRLLDKHKGEEISITLTGHSMGSSLALLLAYDISELGLNKSSKSHNVPVTVFSFGGPRVGNIEFKQRCEELGIKVLRIVNAKDPITKMPGVFFNEKFRVFMEKYALPWRYSSYAHVGVELLVDFFKFRNPFCVHELESYINNFRSSGSSKGFLEWDDEIIRDVVERAKGLMAGGERIRNELLQWRNAAMNMLNLFQSQWT